MQTCKDCHWKCSNIGKDCPWENANIGKETLCCNCRDLGKTTFECETCGWVGEIKDRDKDIDEKDKKIKDLEALLLNAEERNWEKDRKIKELERGPIRMTRLI